MPLVIINRAKHQQNIKITFKLNESDKSDEPTTCEKH